MRVRDQMYFEPRVISDRGTLSWFNEEYSSDELLCHAETTVYVRDNGKKLFVYVIVKDDGTIATMKVIDELPKKTKNTCYGYSYGGIDTEREQELLDKIRQCKNDLISTSSKKRQNDLNKYLRRLTKELKKVRRNAVQQAI
ncbi:MAG: hypothetical protein Q4E81_05500 [Succinatimonas sp.]|nr:hypothetical protein [Succinatimonas sp.]